MDRLNYNEIINEYSFKLTSEEIDEINNQLIKGISSKKIIVLDDDPTGTQTVHSIPVYTSWDYKTIIEILEDESKVVYILTNSRAFDEVETEKFHRQFAQDILSASRELNKDFILISRSDSTLRGHYPLETSVLYEEVSKYNRVDGEIIIPFFQEGGRFTINNIHYVKMGDELIPAGQTEFAKDTTFGYKASDLKKWIEEKTRGKYKQEDVVGISIEELRQYKKEEILQKLLECDNFSKIIVNALDYKDLKLFVSILIEAMNTGKNYLFRTAASFVKIIGGVRDKEILDTKDLFEKGKNKTPGITIVGSYIKKSTQQFERLCELDNLAAVPFDVAKVRNDKDCEVEIKKVIDIIEQEFTKGKDVCVFTSNGQKREFVGGKKGINQSDLEFSVKVSNGLVKVVEGMKSKPSYIIAKGGITSSDLAVKALKVKKAYILGQIFPGIPVWQIENGIPYIVFPGNVGDDDTLKKAVQKARGY